MKKQIFKVLDYIDDNGVEQSLNFECNTPHVLILGNNLDDIVGLEKKMLKNLSDSNGKEIDLIVVDKLVYSGFMQHLFVNASISR